MLKKIVEFYLRNRLESLTDRIERVTVELNLVEKSIEEITSTNGARLMVMPSSSKSRFMELVDIRSNIVTFKSLLEIKRKRIVGALK